ncbi:hypothetical protein AVEN_175343-1 [Araneus ventricosus]|uniref:DUF5641 domain-containing protein n=1 Tax=Araneus ventricosus TaxID=182803 RepID=A0A4Y2TED8_ARAVE|nr:hypothetical protein AVEN_175343-1 [Araneus ventricosus]
MPFRVPSGSLPTLKKLKPFAYLEISIYVALQTETGPLFVGVEWKFGEWRDNSFVLVIGQHSKLREYIVNSRPLTYVTDSFSEPNPLTPLDFLQYDRKDHDYSLHFAELVNKASSRESLIKRKKYQTTLLKHFWIKWKEQYLLDLKTVHHFKSPNAHKELKIDDVVLVEGSSKSKLLWDLGTIQETFQGRDGHIRACLVKTKKGLFRKPVQLIYPLEINE